MGMEFIGLKTYYFKIPLYIKWRSWRSIFLASKCTFPIISLTRFLWLSLFLAQKYRPPHRHLECNRNTFGGDYVGRNVCTNCNDYNSYKEKP